MTKSRSSDIAITGIGVTSSIGQGKENFMASLMQGHHAFSHLKREGRFFGEQRFLGAEIGALTFPKEISEASLRNVSLSGKAALVTLHEAWNEANLFDVDSERIGLVIGGSNFQQREQVLTQHKYRDNPHFITPSYAMTFMDTDICGLCTEHFPIRGMSCSVGGASASGQVAIIQSIQAIQAGLVDVCIVLAPLMDLSFWECQGFRSIGAMGSDRFSNNPELACRPFDQNRDGFIFGESCGAIVLEKNSFRQGLSNSKSINSYNTIVGWGHVMDGNRNPNSDIVGEMKAINLALAKADFGAKDIDYINPHGSASVSGDEVELNAIREVGLNHARINSTKSIIGHGLSAAGLVEVIATNLQMKEQKLHPMRNFDNPISDEFFWVGGKAIQAKVERALSISLGFGGISTALCMSR